MLFIECLDKNYSVEVLLTECLGRKRIAALYGVVVIL